MFEMKSVRVRSSRMIRTGRSAKARKMKQMFRVLARRKLKFRWTVEAATELNAYHGIDIEAELTAALTAEILK